MLTIDKFNECIQNKENHSIVIFKNELHNSYYYFDTQRVYLSDSIKFEVSFNEEVIYRATFTQKSLEDENFKMNLIKTILNIISLDMTDRKNSWIEMLKSIDNLI